MSAGSRKESDLEELLAEANALRQRYRTTSQEEPPVTLDDAIRAAARREVRARPQAMGSGFGAAWRVPASVAAVLVVGVTVALMVSQHDARLLTTQRQASSRITVETKTKASKDEAESAPNYPARKEEPEKGTAKTAPQLRTPTQVNSRASSLGSAGARVEKSELEAKIENPAPRTAMDPEEALGRQPPAQTALPAVTAASAPPVAGNVTAARPPAPEAAAKPTADGTVAVGALSKRQASPGVADGDSKVSSWEKDPQTWLAHVEQLRVAGQTRDAEVSFRAFRTRYPDYQLPPGFVVPVQSSSD